MRIEAVWIRSFNLEPTINGTVCNRTGHRKIFDITNGLLETKKKLKTYTFSRSLFHTGPLVLCKRVKPKVGDNNSCHTNHMKWQRKRSPFKAIKSYISIIILTNTKTSGPRQFRLVNRTQSAFLQKKYIGRRAVNDEWAEKWICHLINFLIHSHFVDTSINWKGTKVDGCGC